MKTRYLYAAAFAIALLVATGAWAQDNREQDRNQFNDHDRQVTRDWHNQHQKYPARGLRPQDRLTPAQESRLERGREFDRDLRRQAHYAPADLRRRLPPPPRNHVYVVIGGNIALVDSVHHIVRDVIRLHEDIHH